MPHPSIVCEVTSRYQHIIVDIHLERKCEVVGSPAATYRRACAGTETCGVPIEIALGLLFSVYPTHEQCYLKFTRVLKPLCDALP